MYFDSHVELKYMIINKNKLYKPFALILVMFFFSVQSQAATRTIQYIGIAETLPESTLLSPYDFSDKGIASSSRYVLETACTLVVMNTGETPQKVTAFLPIMMDAAAQTSTKVDATGLPVEQFVEGHFKNSGNPVSKCIGEAQLLSGEFCVLRYFNPTAIFSGFVGLCSGYLTVEDVTPEEPGSVVASGSVYMTQEALVLGGQLMGAMYMSGSGFDSKNINTENYGDDTNDGGFADLSTIDYFTSNMNIFCAEACNAGNGSWSSNECQTYCGGQKAYSRGYNQNPAAVDTYDDDNTVDVALTSDTLYKNVNAVIVTEAGLTNDDIQANHCDSDGNNCQNFNTRPGYQENADESDIYGSNAGGLPNKASQSTSFIRTANPRWAGGMVYEQIIGPFRSICSANQAFFDEGGENFDHDDAVDAGMIVYDNDDAKTLPKEALACNHKHGQSDLFMGVGSSSPFSVNGGAPF